MIYFVRHGETEANRNKILQGHLNTPLNERGIEQAYQARDNLANINIDVIYSSPLIRAFNTASIINEKHNLEIIIDDRLKEFFGGDLQGECLLDWNEEKRSIFLSNPEHFNAESWNSFNNRVIEFFKEIEYANKNILLVSHSGVFRNIYRYIYQIDDVHFDFKTIKNASVIKIDTKNKKITFLN